MIKATGGHSAQNLRRRVVLLLFFSVPLLSAVIVRAQSQSQLRGINKESYVGGLLDASVSAALIQAAEEDEVRWVLDGDSVDVGDGDKAAQHAPPPSKHDNLIGEVVDSESVDVGDGEASVHPPPLHSNRDDIIDTDSVDVGDGEASVHPLLADSKEEKVVGEIVDADSVDVGDTDPNFVEYVTGILKENVKAAADPNVVHYVTGILKENVQEAYNKADQSIASGATNDEGQKDGSIKDAPEQEEAVAGARAEITYNDLLLDANTRRQKDGKKALALRQVLKPWSLARTEQEKIQRLWDDRKVQLRKDEKVKPSREYPMEETL